MKCVGLESQTTPLISMGPLSCTVLGVRAHNREDWEDLEVLADVLGEGGLNDVTSMLVMSEISL